MTTPPRTPTTAAGRALLERLTEDEDYEWRSDIEAAILAIEAEAIAAERARIRAAVEGLSTSCLVLGSSCMPDCHRVTAKAVLALLDPQP
jgi:hypothetical protein